MLNNKSQIINDIILRGFRDLLRCGIPASNPNHWLKVVSQQSPPIEISRLNLLVLIKKVTTCHHFVIRVIGNDIFIIVTDYPDSSTVYRLSTPLKSDLADWIADMAGVDLATVNEHCDIYPKETDIFGAARHYSALVSQVLKMMQTVAINKYKIESLDPLETVKVELESGINSGQCIRCGSLGLVYYEDGREYCWGCFVDKGFAKHSQYESFAYPCLTFELNEQGTQLSCEKYGIVIYLNPVDKGSYIVTASANDGAYFDKTEQLTIKGIKIFLIEWLEFLRRESNNAQ